MPHTELDQIPGKPTHKKIQELRKQLYANLAAITCSHGYGNGHLRVTMPDTTYNTRYREVNTELAKPSAYPEEISAKMQKHTVANLEAEHPLKNKDYKLQEIVKNITRNQINVVVPWLEIVKISDRTLPLCGVSLKDILKHLFRKYPIHDWKVDQNLQVLYESFNVDEGIDTFIDHQERSQEFSQDGSDPITEIMMIRTSNKAIARTNLFEKDCKEWCSKPKETRDNWSQWTTFW